MLAHQRPRLTPHFGFLLAILALAAFLRLYHLNALSLWVDEAFTAYLTQQSDILHVLRGDVHPPLYFALITLWARIAGDSEVALRVFSAWLSLINVVLSYQMARQWLGLLPPTLAARGAFVPLLMAFLMALSDMEIYIGQEARSYALQVTWALLGTWAYLRYWQYGRKADGILWALCACAMLYTYYLGALTFAAHGLHAVWSLRGRRRWGAVLAGLVAGGLFLPWALAMVLPYQVGTIGTYVKTDPSNLETLGVYARSFLGGQWLFLLVMAGMGTWQAGKAHQRGLPHALLLVLVWAALALGLPFIANARSQLLLFDYRLSQLSLPLCLWVAWGAAQWRAPALRWWLAVMLVFSVATTDVYRPKPDWRGLAQSISARVQTGEGVLIDFGGGDFEMSYALEGRLPIGVTYRAARTWALYEPQTYEAGLLAYIDSFETLWLIRWNDATSVLDKLAFTRHQVVQSIPLWVEAGFNIWLYQYKR